MKLNPVRIAGLLYNLGNIVLFLSPLALGEGDVIGRFLAQPLPALAAILFFSGGIALGLNSFHAGCTLFTFAAALLTVHCLRLEAYVAAFFAAVFHTGGVFIGMFADFFARRFGKSPNRWLRLSLGTPPNAAGYGGMISRIPVGLDVIRTGDWLLGLTCLLWLAADFLVTRARLK